MILFVFVLCVIDAKFVEVVVTLLGIVSLFGFIALLASAAAGCGGL